MVILIFLCQYFWAFFPWMLIRRKLRDHSLDHHAACKLRSRLPIAGFKHRVHAFEVQNQLEYFGIVWHSGMMDKSVPVLHQVYFNQFLHVPDQPVELNKILLWNNFGNQVVYLLTALNRSVDKLLFVLIIWVVCWVGILQLHLLNLYLIKTCFLDTWIRYMLDLRWG